MIFWKGVRYMIEWLTIAVGVLGGLCLFLYGMKGMGEGLEKVAGTKMQQIIESLTGNIVKGILVGAVVTAIIQSSSATTVMVVGFVSAGIMTLKQAVGVIMGANIGTTATSFILSAGDISGSGLMSLLKPDFLMYVLVIVGILLIMGAKRERSKDIGEIIFGLGILFIGMDIMSAAMGSIDDVYFQKAFTMFSSNPFFGVLIGAAVTALIQSSSASIGILLAVSATGAVTFAGAAPIILGQNIGTCVTALLSSVGSSKEAKKAALVHLYFNVIGTIVFLILLYSIHTLAPYVFPFWNSTMGRLDIAVFHLFFNVLCTLLFLPFNKVLVRLVEFTVSRDKQVQKETELTNRLDDRFLYSPSVALSQCKSVMTDMFRLSTANVRKGAETLFNKKDKEIQGVYENETKVDDLEGSVSRYLLKITDKDLTEKEAKIAAGYIHILTDIERMSDHAKNLAEYAQEMIDRRVDFTDKAYIELRNMLEATFEIMELTVQAFIDNDKDAIKKIQPYEDVIDLFTETLKIKHINRLTKQKCSADSGIIFVEVTSNIERIADHCSNVAVSVYQLNSSDLEFDPHEYVHDLKHNKVEGYDTYFKEFQDKYYTPVM